MSVVANPSPTMTSLCGFGMSPALLGDSFFSTIVKGDAGAGIPLNSFYRSEIVEFLDQLFHFLSPTAFHLGIGKKNDFAQSSKSSSSSGVALT